MHVIETINDRRFIKANNEYWQKRFNGHYNHEAPYGATNNTSICHNKVKMAVPEMRSNITCKELGFKVRGKRSTKDLYDLISRKGWRIERNWKERKVRKQWMSNRSIAILKNKKPAFESKQHNIKECIFNTIAYNAHIKDVNYKHFYEQFGDKADRMMEQYRGMLKLNK